LAVGVYRSKRVQTFKKPRRDFKIVDTRRAKSDKFRSEAPQILGTTVQNLDVWAT